MQRLEQFARHATSHAPAGMRAVGGQQPNGAHAAQAVAQAHGLQDRRKRMRAFLQKASALTVTAPNALLLGRACMMQALPPGCGIAAKECAHQHEHQQQTRTRFFHRVLLFLCKGNTIPQKTIPRRPFFLTRVQPVHMSLQRGAATHHSMRQQQFNPNIHRTWGETEFLRLVCRIITPCRKSFRPHSPHFCASFLPFLPDFVFFQNAHLRFFTPNRQYFP